jgi:hypothetical protein
VLSQQPFQRPAGRVSSPGSSQMKFNDPLP